MFISDFSLLNQINIGYKTIVDETDPNNVYIGIAKPGTALGDSNWQIKKITKSGSITTIGFAGSSNQFVFEWDERASYTYN